MRWADPVLRFWDRVDKSGDCWIWTGPSLRKGYGKLKVGDRYWQAHRFAYTITKGPIPEGMVLDHLCRTPACVRPDHLEAVTPRENGRRGINGVLTTHCPRGHEYTAENTTVHRGHRTCRACNRIAVAEYKSRRRRERSKP